MQSRVDGLVRGETETEPDEADRSVRYDVARQGVGQRCLAVFPKLPIEHRDEVRCRVGQGSVQVEENDVDAQRLSGRTAYAR